MPAPRLSLIAAALALELLAGCGGGSDDAPGVVDKLTPAAGCFDGALYKPGAAADARYAMSDNSGATGTRTVAWRVAGEAATYNGVDGLVAAWVRDVIDYPAVPGVSGSTASREGSTITSFVTPVAPGVLRQYGWASVPTLSGVQGTITVTYAPPLDDTRGLLLPGDTLTLRKQGTRKTLNMIEDSTKPIDETEVIRFVGRETLDLPAGRFTACRFDIGQPLVRTEWIAQGLMVQEQRVARGERSTLTEMTVNGKLP